jgi:pimeloyl-ACP methyl ester carboxylesterase
MSGARGTIVFVHGMYLNGASWDPWIARAEARGFTAVAPSWPFHDGGPADLRAAVDPGLGRLTFGQVTEHLAGVVRALPEPPLLVGHSIGGLVVQKLVNDGLGRAGVALSPAPPVGVLSLSPHFYRANWGHVNPFAGNKPVRMTPQRFHYAFANTTQRSASDAAFDEYVVPESRNVPRSTLGPAARIRFRRPHAPLLLVAGTEDHLTPARMVARNARAYRRSTGPLELRTLQGKDHFLCNAPGWEQVADLVLDWLDTQA